MSEEKYTPSEEEMIKAEGTMHGYQKELSEKRESMASEADMELMKKCTLNYSTHDNGYQEHIAGKAGGENIEISYFPKQETYMAYINGNDVKDEEMAKALWAKFYPVAQLLKQSEKLEKDAREKMKLTASRLLDL
jgi:hypothetical protein